MKTILYMVTSANGLIAREDGDEDWLPDEGWDEFAEMANGFNNIVMGRETYDQVTTRYKDCNFDDINCTYKLIITNNRDFIVPAGYIVVNSPEEAVDFIRNQGLSELFLIGGGKLNGEFAKRGLINEIQFTINPYIIGKGRPVFGDIDFEQQLELVEYTKLSKGRIRLKYDVLSQKAEDDISELFNYCDLTMRRIKYDDIEKVVDLINEAFSYQDPVIGEPRASVEYLSKLINETDFYVVEDNNDIAGCFYVQSKNTALNFGLLAVSPAYRGKGLAAKIIKAIEVFAVTAKFHTIELEYTNVSGWLKKYYESYGFYETDEKRIWGPIELIKMRKVILDENSK